MGATAACPRCGTTSDPGRFAGMCPRCLLGTALDVAPAESVPRPLNPGDPFRGMTVLSVLGRGGMGIVYRARHEGLGRDVALKILDPALATDPDFAARFEREAKTLAALDHPNIVKVYDSGRDEGLAFLVMELVDGRSLREHLKAGGLKPGDAERIARSAAAALEAAHAAGIVHRDVKPENVLIGPDGRVKLVDFGLAKPVSASALTKTGSGMGTPHYMAPEQVSGARDADLRADLYALGVLFYELLSGELPIGRFGPPCADRRLSRAVLRLLEKDLDRRTPTARAFLDDLDRAPVSRALLGLGAAALAVAVAASVLASVRVRPQAPPAWRDWGGSAAPGGISRGPGNADHPCLAVDARGFPCVAWDLELDGRPRICLRRWNGREWEELDGSASGDGLSRRHDSAFRPSLALDPEGRPVVAFVTNVAGRPEVYVRRWTGRLWESFGRSAEGGGVSEGTAPAEWTWLALDRAGNPTVVWTGGSQGRRDVYVRRWTGSAWEALGASASPGGISRTGGPSIFPKVRIDPEGRAVVAWEEHSPGNAEIYLRRWDGASWAELDGSGSGGGVSRTPGSSFHPSLALDSAGNPVLAWHESRPMEWDVYLKRWDGRAWVELGGSATGGGISDNPGASHQGEVALGRDDRPVVAWHDNTFGAFDLFLKRWTGAAWEELDGSASPGGICKVARRSIWKSLAVDPEGNPVIAWTVEKPGNFEICCTGFRRP